MAGEQTDDEGRIGIGGREQGGVPGGPDHGNEGPTSEQDARAKAPVGEQLDESECLRLIGSGGVGRIAYTGRFGLVVLPVNYKMHEGAVVFRTAVGGPLDEDLRTGITGADYQVAFEIDEIDVAAQEGWSVLVQGPAHHVESEADRQVLVNMGVNPWIGGEREMFVRITPSHITGRRIRHSG
jgi:Pyridoxamine 5'-phosphate oxidase